MESQGGKLLQMLRGLNQQELRAIRRRSDWCSIDSYDNHRSFTMRLRDSIDRAVDQGDITYGEFMEFVRDDILLTGPNLPKTRIKRILQKIPLSASPIGEERRDEEWYSAQAYGALQNKLSEDFRVYLEYEFDNYAHERADIFVDSKQESDTDKRFLIESKVASSLNGNIARAEGQLQRYHDTIDDRDHTFVFIIGTIEDQNYSSADDSQAELSEYTDIPSGFSRLEQLHNTTVIERVLQSPNR